MLPDTENMEVQKRQDFRLQMLVGVSLVIAGLTVSGFALARIASHDMHMAQLAPSPSSQPGSAQGDQTPSGQTSGSSAPAESKPGGTRPTTPAPEPARPDADAQKAGAPTALPPAPAEKMAPAINTK